MASKEVIIGHYGLTALMDAVGAAEKALQRVDGATVWREGDSFTLNHVRELERLKWARHVLAAALEYTIDT